MSEQSFESGKKRPLDGGSSTPSAASGRRKRARGIALGKDSSAPKKPLTPFKVFSNKMKERVMTELKKKHQGIEQRELLSLTTTTLSEMWNLMSDSAKRSFQEEAAKDKERYDRELALFRPSAWMDAKGKIHDPNAPKQPRSAFVFFGSDYRSKLMEQHPEASVAEISKLLGAKWREIDEDTKRRYQQRSDDDKERYRREMASYTPPKPEDRPEWLELWNQVQEEKRAAKEAKKEEKRAVKRREKEEKTEAKAHRETTLKTLQTQEADAASEMTAAQEAARAYMDKRDKAIRALAKHLKIICFDTNKSNASPSAMALFGKRLKTRETDIHHDSTTRQTGTVYTNTQPGFPWLFTVPLKSSKIHKLPRDIVKSEWDKLSKDIHEDYQHAIENIRSVLSKSTSSRSSSSLINDLSKAQQLEGAWSDAASCVDTNSIQAGQLQYIAESIYNQAYPVPDEIKHSLHMKSRYRLMNSERLSLDTSAMTPEPETSDNIETPIG